MELSELAEAMAVCQLLDSALVLLETQVLALVLGYCCDGDCGRGIHDFFLSSLIMMLKEVCFVSNGCLV